MTSPLKNSSTGTFTSGSTNFTLPQAVTPGDTVVIVATMTSVGVDSSQETIIWAGTDVTVGANTVPITTILPSGSSGSYSVSMWGGIGFIGNTQTTVGITTPPTICLPGDVVLVAANDNQPGSFSSPTTWSNGQPTNSLDSSDGMAVDYIIPLAPGPVSATFSSGSGAASNVLLDEAGAPLLDEGGQTILDESSGATVYTMACASMVLRPTLSVPWTENLCPNPSMEVSLEGYSEITGFETLFQDISTSRFGNYSLEVTTPGRVPGEGITTPMASIETTANGSASLYILGEAGFLTVSAVQTPGGQILGAIQVQLDGQDWQRIELDNLGLRGGQQFYLVVSTTTAQALTFWVDAVQYEPESPAHPYIDGDSASCTWVGTPGLSASFQQFQFPLILTGAMTLEGNLTTVAHGEIFVLGLLTGGMDMSGQPHPMAAVTKAGRTVIPPAIDTGVPGLPWEISGGGSLSCTAFSPGSALRNFGVWETGVDPDPAMTLLGPNNAGTDDAPVTQTSYNQIYGTFSAPKLSLDSQGNARWQAAAYMAAGFKIASQAVFGSTTPNAVNFAQFQVEKATSSTPTAYQLPRALLTLIKPTNLNYVTNPSFEASGGSFDTGWTAISGATLSSVTNPDGSHSLHVSVASAGQGVSVSVADLIVGDTFTASAYLEPVSAGISDINMSVGGVSVSANPSGYAYGLGAYGSGPYGGVNVGAAAMVTGSFAYRPSAAFQAPASTVTVSFIPVIATGASYPLTFNIDNVMVAPGEVLTDYGDGNSDDWQWELGGTPNLSRSYFYERQSVAASAVEQVLQQHIPLGLTAYTAQWALPPTQ